MESKNQIRERILNTAFEHWGYDNRQSINDFDPLVELLINTISSEIHHISSRINETETRILNRLIANLSTDFDTSLYAHTILQVHPIGISQEINKFHQFQFLHEGDNDDYDVGDIYFSPTRNQITNDIKVKYLHYNQTTYLFDLSNKKIVEDKIRSHPLNLNEIELGLYVNEKIDSIENMVLFIDLNSNLFQNNLFSNIEHLQISCLDNKISFHKGIHQTKRQHQKLKNRITKHYSSSSKLERHVISYYSDYYNV